MKHFFLTAAVLAVLAVGTVSAQTSEIPAPKRHYINLGYVNQTLEPEAGGESLKSDNGAAIEFGSSFFFNNKKARLRNGAYRAGFQLFGFAIRDIQSPVPRV